ncbi:MAG: peptidylprolyl isomerase [Fibrobacteria bacterium]|nr:peptidylprolyl isomerase [Fibrobacteria bacterium]
MMMQKIRDNAIWVVLVAVVCFIALIFVDWGMSPGNSMTQKTVIGEAEGESIRYEEFDRYVQQQANLAVQQGQDLSAEDYAKIRRQIFDEMVRLRIVQKVYAQYQLKGSPEEVLDFMRRNPPPGAEKAPIFMGPDSQFSKAAYEKWLSDPRIYSDPYMKMMESEVSQIRLPEEQLQKILQAGIYPTRLDLEQGIRRQQTRGWGVAVVVPQDSFRVGQPPRSEVDAYFAAHPDSFFVPRDIAKTPYVHIVRRPSHADSVEVKSFADTLVVRIKAGESFDTLAKDYSEDPGSAAQYGRLGGLQRRTQWVPVFSNAVATLEVGQMSEPVQSSFGWHIIRLNAKELDERTKDTLYDVSHILLRVTPSPDAIEAIKERLEAIAAQVKKGVAFEVAVQAESLSIDTARILHGEIATTVKGPLVGLSGWSFRGQKDEKVSEVLENDQALFLAGPSRVLQAGRDLETSAGRIFQSLMVQKQRFLAQKWLDSLSSTIVACGKDTACLQKLPKVVVTPLEDRPAQSFVLGYGYQTPELIASWTEAAAKPGTWSKSIQTVSGAAMLRLDSVVVPSDTAVAQSLAESGRRESARMSVVRSLYGAWSADMKRKAKIEDNLDRFYRD